MAKRWAHHRFEAMMAEPNEKGCRLWKGATKEGKPFFLIETWPVRKATSGQAYSYRFYKAQIPEGLFAVNRCGERLCVEPSHLWLKSRQQIIQAAIKRGTFKPNPDFYKMAPHHRGKQNGNCKYSDEKVAQIIAERKAGAKVVLLARRHGLGTSTIWWFLTGRSK